ncbi:TetR/AcrR family transcriptional regulator [Streptomyces thermodiastaticus]|jgi:AcrR family transcriptional regulator|uniref:TetR/AcrR family transcriptional regulator n=1 Tax=Streptomyces thermodiastaticus TaxID=44061 RepID=UPI0016760ABD|nr:TetR family transcriptional regulator [Streptomyces thermodiastaticus]MCE7553260.1 TetR family transcriptional regulator [Streptomyces thermodiastaticus]
MHVMSERESARGGLRERKKRATRAALAEAAVRLAARHGVEKVTVEAISAEAGVSPRTFFNYFASRDDAFLIVDADAAERIRLAVLDAPAGLTPLQAVRDALAGELAEAEQQHELWTLHAKVLRAAPDLLVRSLSAHVADETRLAEAVARRLSPGSGGREAAAGTGAGPQDAEERRKALDLYPRLVAAVATTAVRVSVEHWSSRPEEGSFADVFRQVFALLAAGLPAPARV